MKLFRRFLMFATPLILIGLAFVLVPSIRPDVSDYRDLRKLDFHQGIEISKTAGVKTVSGYFQESTSKGFRVFDMGKIRLAIRDDNASANPYYGYYSGSASQSYPLLIDPPRDLSASKKASVSPASIMPGHGATPINFGELPTGTRLFVDSNVYDFIDGEFKIGNRTFSTTAKPILIVLREDQSIELVEELDEKHMPADIILP